MDRLILYQHSRSPLSPLCSSPSSSSLEATSNTPRILFSSHRDSYSLIHTPAMSMEESISLEETNKIRISLGLKPLTDDKAPAGDKEKEAEDNYAKQREREAKQRESK